MLNYSPLVSVVITTYNYAAYLPKAIQSVLKQTYPTIEIIIIDDGSTDDSSKVFPIHESVKYFYQENRGISAARNNGIKRSNGEYILFLDADDWLEPQAIEDNLSLIIEQPTVAFVSGNYYFIRAETGIIEQVKTFIYKDHYTEFLQKNYIGMIAGVLFQKWVLAEIQFDETLEACEDYDLYLNITRKHRVIHHDKFIATYYFHTGGLSHNYQSMISSIKRVLEKQAANLHSPEEKAAYQLGLLQWKNYESFLI